MHHLQSRCIFAIRRSDTPDKVRCRKRYASRRSLAYTLDSHNTHKTQAKCNLLFTFLPKNSPLCTFGWERVFLFLSLNSVFSYSVRGLFFVKVFPFYIIFGETKQKVIARIATTFKALVSVAEANVGLSGRKLNTGNIYYLFSIIHKSISSIRHLKRCAAEATHRKTQTPSCRQTNLYATGFHTINGSRIFTKWISFMMRKKGYSYPKKKNIPVAIIKFVWHNHYITVFAVCKYVYRKFAQLPCI